MNIDDAMLVAKGAPSILCEPGNQAARILADEVDRLRSELLKANADTERLEGAAAVKWTDAELINPRSIDEARFQMCTELHRALYGDVWARPESPQFVWKDMLDRIERAARAFRR